MQARDRRRFHFPSRYRRNVVKFTNYAALSTLILAVFCSRMLGQRGGNQVGQGNHAVEVHLTDQKGKSLNISVKVEVLTQTGLRMAEAYSNHEEGVADFEGFNDGYYQLRVSGPDVETVSLPFQIAATEATHREFVRVDLKNTIRSGESASPGTDPMISAQDLSIPIRAREAFAKGMEAYAKGEDKEAQDALERAIEPHPRYIKAHNNLGVLYLKLGQKSKALAEFSKAVEFDPKFAPGYINLARISLSDGHYVEAEDRLKKALDLDSGALNAMVLLCSTEFARSEYTESLQTAHQLHRLSQEPQYAEVHLIAAQILVGQGKGRDAAAQYQMFVDESPNDPRLPKVKSLIPRLATK
jgi:Tfp pilus assembly protein PilF